MSNPRLRAANVMLFVAAIDLALAVAFFFAGPTALGLDGPVSALIAGALLLGAVSSALVGGVLRKKALAAMAADRDAAPAGGDRPVVWRRQR
jgi:hypothetical protein